MPGSNKGVVTSMEYDPDAETAGESIKIPVPADVAEAIRTLIRWSGDDPEREGLVETPARVARAWKEYCRGYDDDPAYHLSRLFHDEIGSASCRGNLCHSLYISVVSVFL